ncbi:SpoIIE family protein phosphatase [Magnetospira sp. QH-2]|uniref:SpoIIE family protein phosphatase n=1 Tax=Magnetospira sp. (strain QH-2) TaxID=1288970 RepID=UPI0003E80D1E|nr:SpoIIE family protein phosphatase [Magnetospira sp. QH-2]CCQ74974.1 putative phosphoserine phosphatase RsbU like protein [Magnetospira sp. QH-2]
METSAKTVPAAPPGGEDLTDPLELLATLSEDFAMSQDLDGAMARGLGHIVHNLGAEAGSLFLVDQQSSELVCVACIGPVDITGLRLEGGQGIVGQCIDRNVGEIVRNVDGDPRFHRAVDKETGFKTLSVLCAPMSVRDERVGAVQVLNKVHGGGLFGFQDLNLLKVLTASMGLAIRNARLASQLVEQERIKRELELASEIQRSLLPMKTDEGFPVSGLNVPAREMSGDFFNYFAFDDGRIYFCLGDVSGKGMDAAMLMAKASSLFRALGKAWHEPGRLMGRLNEEICETASMGRFITMVVGLYDPRTGMVRLSNAGHEPPLIFRRDGGMEDFPADAPPLGITPLAADENGAFPEVEFNLDGGTLYVFTDGVTEGKLADGSMFDIKGVTRILGRTSEEPVEAILNTVRQILCRDGEELRDDLTLLAVDDTAARAERGDDIPSLPRRQSDDEPGEKLLSLRLPARPDRLKLIRAAVGEAAKASGCSSKITHDVVIAVDEACQNVVRHAYPEGVSGAIRVDVYREGSDLIFHIRDFSPVPVDVDKVRPRDLDDIKPGGLGTHLIREVMEEVEFLQPAEGSGNLLRLVKTIG